MYKLSFYVPQSHLEPVKTALFAIGAGHYKNYDQCCWQVLGEGQFRPLENSKPFFGDTQQLAKVLEYKVEMICNDAVINDAVHTLLRVHPFEQPAYDIHRILTVEDFPF